jgi:flagellar motor switch protein FliN/FliY
MSTTTETPPNLDILMNVIVRLSVELGTCQIPMREVMQLNVGSVVRLDKPTNTPVDLFVNNTLVARGEVVAVEDRFAIKITELLGGATTP